MKTQLTKEQCAAIVSLFSEALSAIEAGDSVSLVIDPQPPGTRFDTLKWTHRTYNVLWLFVWDHEDRARMTLEDLTHYTIRQLRRKRGCGLLVLNEVRKVLNEHGMCLLDDAQPSLIVYKINGGEIVYGDSL